MSPDDIIKEAESSGTRRPVEVLAAGHEHLWLINVWEGMLKILFSFMSATVSNHVEWPLLSLQTYRHDGAVRWRRQLAEEAVTPRIGYLLRGASSAGTAQRTSKVMGWQSRPQKNRRAKQSGALRHTIIDWYSPNEELSERPNRYQGAFPDTSSILKSKAVSCLNIRPGLGRVAGKGQPRQSSQDSRGQKRAQRSVILEKVTIDSEMHLTRSVE